MTVNELKHFCFNCNTLQKEPIGEEGICDKCLEKQTWFKEDVYTCEVEAPVQEHSVKITSSGWLVDNKFIER